MANLTAIFELIDKMSDKLDKIADGGNDMLNEFERAGDAADSAFDRAVNGAQETARAADSAAQSIESVTSATDYWTDAVGNYDKSALEAIYSTEELVEMGFKAEAALEAEARAAAEAEESLEDLDEQSEETGETGVNAVEGIASALAAAGITAILKEIAAAAYEMADGFSEAEKVIVASTGATGAELDSLMASATNVFADSNAESLEEIAAGMGTIAQQTHLTGEALEEATLKGHSLRDLYGFEIPESTRTASALMKNFNITAAEAYDIIAAGAMNGANKNGDLLDILNEYSAQYAALGLSADEFISSLVDGAEAGVFSVDKVGDAVKEFNIRAKDGSAATAAAFELLEMNAEEMTQKFAAGGDTASDAFFQVVNALEAMEDPVQRNAAAVGLFGTMYEDLEATILPVLSGIEGGTVDTADALDQMADNAKSMSDGWQEASNSVSTAFSTAISPTITKASNAVSGIVKSVGDFLNKHPVVTKAITAIGIGLGVVVAGIAGVTFVTQVAIPAVTAFGVALNTALGPIGWVALAITAVVAAGTALIAMMSDTEDELDGLTATTRQQYYELQDLNAEYEAACEKYGETSEEASSLRYQIDVLSESFEANKKSVEELAAECDEVIEKHQTMMEEFDSTTDAVRNEELGNLALITRLEELASTTTHTSATQAEMEAIIASLNDSVDGLSLSYEDLTTNQGDALASLRAYAEAEAKRQKQQAMYDEYVELIRLQAEEQAKLAEVTEEVAAAEEWAAIAGEEYYDYLSMVTKYDTTGMAGFGAMFTSEYKNAVAAEEALETAINSQTELQTALDETTARIAALEQEWTDIATAEQEAAEQGISYEDAVTTALESVQEDIEELCAAYDAAYEAARESIDGQIGLFDTMATETETSIADMEAAFQSQIDYLNTYTENLQKAAQYGLDEGLIASLSDGSEESAGYLNAIIENIESLGDSSAEAQQFVDDFNASFQEVEQAKDEFATTVATMETDFDAKMAEIEGRLDTAIDNMNMEADAAAAAHKTMDAYTQAIREGGAKAEAAAQAAAAAVASALNTGSTGGASITVEGNATGTTDAADVFVAGEEGPELIVGAGGSTVFPADETTKIINAVTEETGGGHALPSYAPPGYTGSDNIMTETTGGGETTKKVVLAIEGKGNIELTGGKADRESLLAFLYEYLKPVLSEILTEEIFEEGDMSYEY